MNRFTRIRALTTVASIAVATLALSAASAFAQDYPPAEDFSVTCAPADPAAGADVACEVVGAIPGEDLTASAEIDGDVFFEEDGVADEDGTFSFGFTVPSDAEGDVIVRVVGSESGQVATTVLSVAVAVDADEDEAVTPAPTGTLPLTGAQVATLGLLGLVLIGGGLLALRRREDAASVA